MSKPTKAQKPNYGEPWSQGVVITTPSTRRYSAEEMERASAIERRTIYYNFDIENQGRGRVLVAEFTGPTARECLGRTIACVNALRGVPDPEAFVNAADALKDLLRNVWVDLSLKEAQPLPPWKADLHEKANAVLDAYRAARGGKS